MYMYMLLNTVYVIPVGLPPGYKILLRQLTTLALSLIENGKNLSIFLNWFAMPLYHLITVLIEA